MTAAPMLLAVCLVTQQENTAGLRFFEGRIRPLFVEHCYECHSTTARRTRGGLLLDSREGLRRGGDSGAVIVPAS